MLSSQSCDLHPFVLREPGILLFSREPSFPRTPQMGVNSQVPRRLRDRKLLVKHQLHCLAFELVAVRPPLAIPFLFLYLVGSPQENLHSCRSAHDSWRTPMPALAQN